jgi:hypothetical protein
MEQDWSIAELTRRLHKGASTLHRWRNGQTVSFEMPTLLQLCEYAGLTLDDVFGLQSTASAEAQGASTGLVQKVEKQEVELRKIQGLIQAANSMLSTIDQSIDTSLGASKMPVEQAAVKNAKTRLKKLQQWRDISEPKEDAEDERKQG